MNDNDFKEKMLKYVESAPSENSIKIAIEESVKKSLISQLPCQENTNRLKVVESEVERVRGHIVWSVRTAIGAIGIMLINIFLWIKGGK